MHRLNISCLFYIFSTMLSKILRLNGLRNFSILFFGVVLLKDDMKFLSGIIHLSLKVHISHDNVVKPICNCM